MSSAHRGRETPSQPLIVAAWSNASARLVERRGHYLAGKPMEDRSSRPNSSPNKTSKEVTKRCVSLRLRLREGPVQLACRLGITPFPVHRILISVGLNRPSHVNRATGELVRRYEHDYRRPRACHQVVQSPSSECCPTTAAPTAHTYGETPVQTWESNTSEPARIDRRPRGRSSNLTALWPKAGPTPAATPPKPSGAASSTAGSTTTTTTGPTRLAGTGLPFHSGQSTSRRRDRGRWNRG